MFIDEVLQTDLLSFADRHLALTPLDSGLTDTKFPDVLVGVVVDIKNDAVVTQGKVDALDVNCNFHAEILRYENVWSSMLF